MAGIHTTTIDLTTTPVALISGATTWASLRFIDYGRRHSFMAYNSGPACRISGSSSTAATGFPVASSGVYTADLNPGNVLYAFTTASTGSLVIQVDGQ